MKRMLYILAIVLVALPAYSQTQELSKKEMRNLQKQQKKEQRAEEEARKAAVVGLMVEYQRFVLEADQLKDKRGNTDNVSSIINFIAVDSTHGVIQIGSQTYVGSNGVGGITLEGPVTRYEYSYSEKNGSYMVTYMLRSTQGTYDVRMSVMSSGRADATISSNWPGRVNYLGFLVPPANSRVYKGTSSY